VHGPLSVEPALELRPGFRKVSRGQAPSRKVTDVPTLFRFLTTIAVLAGLAYAAMLALVTYVEPQPREITHTIPPAKLNK
jgi:hypothetical protein